MGVLSVFVATSKAIPEVAFPFNSQVPTVARVGRPYEFQFSASTFAPETSSFTYSLVNQPTWLSLDSATRTLFGAPSSADVGASSFTLMAADSSGAAQLSCTLVVSFDPAPDMQWDIKDQLAASANLSSSQPPVATILPSTAFHFQFRQDSFIDIVQRKLGYYATLTDHTPLPSWLLFDPDSLTFSGIAPQLSAFPQSWNIELIASDVKGFAGATVSFTLAVVTQQLVFVPEEQTVSITTGKRLAYTALKETLFLNGNNLDLGSLQEAQASGPSWLKFDRDTLSLEGTVPEDARDQNVTVTVVDILGNEATALIVLVGGDRSLFAGTVGTVRAQSGKTFTYRFANDLFADQDVDLRVTLPATARWLNFDSTTRALSGEVPTETIATTIQATLTVTSSDLSTKQSQAFTIEVEPVAPRTMAGTRMSSYMSSATNTSNASTPSSVAVGRTHHLSEGAVAGIVVGVVSAVAILAALLILCCPRRQRTRGYVETASPAKPIISRPILPSDAEAITVTTEVQTDVEKQADNPFREMPLNEVEPAPQIALDLPAQSNHKRMKWSKRFSRISQVSSIGTGEDAIRADSNIPEWGRESAALHTPHESFSIPTEIARSSRQLSDLSPSKRALRRLRDKRQSRQSVGLGIDTGGAGVLPRHSSRGARSHKRAVSSLGISTTLDRNSMASLSTRGTSLLSTIPSEFPRPPTRSTFGGSKSIPTLSLTEAEKRRSIRLVDRSDSAADNRSLQDKRQSFIRNRASTSFASPLFAHGSRASLNPKQSVGGSTNVSSASSTRRSKRGKSQLTTYSESSSLEPAGRESRRLSARVRSAFAPSFPRAITGSTLGADDEGGPEQGESSSEYCTTSSSISEADFVAEMNLPRHQRSFVFPGEASPTPPPAPPTSRQASSGRQSTTFSESGKPRQKWRDRLHDSSPLSTAVAVPLAERDSLSPDAKVSQMRRSRLSEPLSLVSNDSLSRGKLERPRLVHTNSKRPVSVEKVQRLSSLRAETEDVRPGSEVWEAMEGAGLMPPSSTEGKNGTQKSNMSGPAFLKFGKHIQKRQLDIPEYAASFVDYKALKKVEFLSKHSLYKICSQALQLIKKLSATPIISGQQPEAAGEPLQDSQASLQANRATFFFRLERELEKVNTFYLQKEAELKLRLRTLLDKKRGLQSRATTASKLSSSYLTLDEGFRLFSNDLDKLQQFVEVNQTAFSKILKKVLSHSPSRTKELYLSRAVDVQPCFNRDIISDLSDQATTSLLELQAWAEGEKINFAPAVDLENRAPPQGQDAFEIENQMVQAANVGNVGLLKEWVTRASSKEEAQERVSSIFLNTVNTATTSVQEFLYTANLVDFNYADQINERNCIHEAAVSGKIEVLQVALSKDADIRTPDVYGRIPLHYACMHGRLEMIRILATAALDTVDAKDLDNFTPLIHGIVHSQASSVQAMLELGALVDPTGSADHIPLNLACQYGSVAIIQHMLRYGPQMLPDAEGLFPQHIVARFGGARETLQMLKDYGVDMDQQDKLYQWTPLFHAASEGHLHCLEQLLQFRAKAGVKDEKGSSAMYYAAWEGHLDCMQRLAQEGAEEAEPPQDAMDLLPLPPSLSGDAEVVTPADPEMIPDLSLPPPIIPLRRYGHNFLDTTKTFILLSFDDLGSDAIEFYGDSRYPAARLTISSKSSDLIPRNVSLPVQDDSKNISFQIENLNTFSIDFDIFPTFGSKVIARAAASSRVFTGKASSSGMWHLELFDPRLRAIGRINFRFQVVTPFHGIPLEITHFATYWKATSQDGSHPSNLVTGSSLSGDFMRLFVQVTRDCVPVLYNEWALPSSKNDLVSRLTYDEFSAAGSAASRGKGVLQGLVGSGIDRFNLASTQRQVARSCASLADTLASLPPDLHLEIHICYPPKAEEGERNLGPTQNINVVVDSVLTVVFKHARHLRETEGSALRNFVFSSYNPDICMALNWKQPNYPVLLCNELGVAPTSSEQPSNSNMVFSCGRTDMSIKESVRIAQSNNFMGLVCSSRLLDLVPALISSVKEAGLVLISDYSNDVMRERPASVLNLPGGVDGLLLENAVLRFKEAIDQ
ncbi:phosphate system positive regulatory protein pho81 [Vermiconidia calcicola]|uniref:Phosphate system positive regulatory protein pho81 n=1 Tax=Vermiconidia calcicola TaxID=1690605 RepID=A0ACC3NTF8_9PEZI|nr:phosphate system positive regulatory protein pho81 [Vermiconidia calcicola]